MKKIFEKIGLLIAIVIGIPILLIVCVGYLIYVPFDIIQYYKMPYYRDLKNKYQFFITSRDVVKFYNHIVNKKLPIEYFKNGDYEYFVKEGIVLLSGWSNDEFEEVNGEWCCNYDDEDEDKKMSTQEIIESDREILKSEHKNLPAKILMIYNKKDSERIEQIKECPHLYFVSL